MRLVVLGESRNTIAGRAEEPAPSRCDRVGKLLHLLYSSRRELLHLPLQPLRALLQGATAELVLLIAEDVGSVALVAGVLDASDVLERCAAG